MGKYLYNMLSCKTYGINAGVVLLALLLLAGCRGKSRPQAGVGVSGGRGAGVSCPLDGLPATAGSLARRPLAVMVENAPAARPQSGLDKACVVYEAITEGGITRFMAIYLHQDAAVVGPVRSVRPHFINLSREYQAGLVHCGESYEALQILAYDSSIINLDQMKYPKPFWRDHARRMPHNLYTATDKLRALMTREGWESPVNPLPAQAGGTVAATVTAPEARVTFGGSVKYKLRLQYDAAHGGYLRYMDSKLHVDRVTGKPLVARNVIIQRVQAQQFTASKLGTYDVSVTGSGPAYLLVDGKWIDGNWHKTGSTGITTFTDTAGAPFPCQPGQTWIELVPVEGRVDYPGMKQ